MKTGFLIFMCIAFLQTSVLAQSANFEKLIGEWEAIDADNKSGKLEVLDSAELYLTYGEEKKPITSFEADFTKSPVWFDFTVADSSDDIAIKSILLFINENLVQWQVFQGEVKRPAHFTEDKGEIIYLRRKKE